MLMILHSISSTPREAFVGLDKPPGIVLCMECAREQAVDYSEDEEDGG